MPRNIYLALSAVAALLACSARPPDYDVVIRNGTLFDGSGSPGYVFVNGVAGVKDDGYTGERPGRALRGPAYEPR